MVYPRHTLAILTTNGVDLYYERAGSGPPLLLVHGLMYSAESWRHQFDDFARDHDVVAVDLRGQHRSQVTEDQAGYDLWNQAEDIHGVVQELELAPCDYVGLSMGGMIGMRLALRHPEDVARLVLVDTSHELESEVGKPMALAFYGMLDAGRLEDLIPATPPIWYGPGFLEAHPGVVAAWEERWRLCDAHGLALAGRGVAERDDISAQVGQVKVPVMVIHGDEDAPIDVEVGRRLAAAIGGSRLEIIPGAGHMSCVDHPEEVTRLLRDFLS
ncbi:MAG: alpha/beta fold hydrolase [Candidatus Dormibacteria bacterium]